MRGDSDEETVSSISSFNSFGSNGNSSERERGHQGGPGLQPSSPVVIQSQKQQFARSAKARKRPSYTAEFRNARANLDVEEEEDSEEDV